MKETKTDYIYHALRTRINNNEYLPDMQITELAVCKEFGVSRTPAREAIKKLTAEKYLTYTPGIGLTVTNIDLADLIEVYEIREALEGIAIRLFCDRKTPSALKKLEALIHHQHHAFNENDSSAFMKHDMEFHHTIFRGCGNKRLLTSLEEIYDLISRVALINKDDPALDALALKHHEELYKCIVKEQNENAVILAQDHVRQLKAYYLKRYYDIHV